MILRTLPLRHGRKALARPPAPLHAKRRPVTTESHRVPHPGLKQPLSADAVHSKEQVARTLQYEIRDPTHPVAQQLEFDQHVRAVTGKVGSEVADPDRYQPYQLLANPPWPKDITLELLMASQAHLGHSTALWHPGNAKYIFGVRGVNDPIHIISLDVTATYLRRACKIVQGVAERGGVILFVGTRTGQARAVVRAAGMAKGYHLFNKWVPGTITNGQQILGNCKKKVVDEFDHEVEGYDDQLHEVAAVKPDLVICLNPVENYILLHECGLNNIPTIGVVDTNCNPTWVTYPIPANDDSLRCIHVIAGVLGRAGQLGQEQRLANAQRGILPHIRPHKLGAPDKAAIARRKEQKIQETAADEFAQMDATEIARLQQVLGQPMTAKPSASAVAQELEAVDTAPGAQHIPIDTPPSTEQLTPEAQASADIEPPQAVEESEDATNMEPVDAMAQSPAGITAPSPVVPNSDDRDSEPSLLAEQPPQPRLSSASATSPAPPASTRSPEAAESSASDLSTIDPSLITDEHSAPSPTAASPATDRVPAESELEAKLADFLRSRSISPEEFEAFAKAQPEVVVAAEPDIVTPETEIVVAEPEVSAELEVTPSQESLVVPEESPLHEDIVQPESETLPEAAVESAAATLPEATPQEEVAASAELGLAAKNEQVEQRTGGEQAKGEETEANKNQEGERNPKKGE